MERIMYMLKIWSMCILIYSLGFIILPNRSHAQENKLPSYMEERFIGLSTSMYGTYVRPGELLIYPYFGYSLDNNREYQPVKLGYGLDEDFRGHYRSSAGQIFLAYGLNEWLALEFEAAYLNASLEKSPNDPSGTPVRIKESGLGDIEGQVRFRWMKETDNRPELFGFVEITVPSQQHKVLIGDPDWDFRPGIGIARNYSWGKVTFRTDLEYNREASSPDIGETALEYLKRLSPAWQMYLSLEGGEGGAPDEWSLIGGLHWHIAGIVFLKIDNAVGISSKATDWEPQMGFLFSIPVRNR